MQILSPKGDGLSTVAEVLRQARVDKRITQSSLAEKLEIGQRQISDIERGATNPTISTVQNVARALDLELMLIPRHLITAVEALLRVDTDEAKRPMYSLADEEGAPDDQERVELGGSDEAAGSRTRRRTDEDLP